MKRIVTIIITIIALSVLVIPVSASSTYSYSYPYFYITEAVKDQTVTIQAYNFPTHDSFRVTMGYYGTYGVGGVVVATTDTGESSSFVATYTIPSTLAGQQKISIRLQSPTSGYFAYNWFYNNSASSSATQQPAPTTTPVPPSYSGYPTFSIAAVVKDQSVTISGKNFPANDTFTVLMGPYGTKGVGGTNVGSTSTGSGGSLSATYSIPSSLAGSSKIAIRLQSSTSGYFAYNWFYNSSTP